MSFCNMENTLENITEQEQEVVLKIDLNALNPDTIIFIGNIEITIQGLLDMSYPMLKTLCENVLNNRHIGDLVGENKEIFVANFADKVANNFASTIDTFLPLFGGASINCSAVFKPHNLKFLVKQDKETELKQIEDLLF